MVATATRAGGEPTQAGIRDAEGVGEEEEEDAAITTQVVVEEGVVPRRATTAKVRDTCLATAQTRTVAVEVEDATQTA
jgi:hypothetical protein